MKKLEHFEEALRLFTQHSLVKYSQNESQIEAQQAVSKALDKIQRDIHNIHDHSRINSSRGKPSGFTKNSDGDFALGGKRSVEQLIKNDSFQAGQKNLSETEDKIAIRIRQSGSQNSKLYFVKGQNRLAEINHALAELCQKFSDVSDHNGYFFLEQQGKRSFEIDQLSQLDDYILLNCFVSFIIAYSLGQSTLQFLDTINKIRQMNFRLLPTCDSASFLKRLEEVTNIARSSGPLETARYLLDASGSDQTFCSTLVWALKNIVGDFINEIRTGKKKNSYDQKYYITDFLLFGTGSIKPEDKSLYKYIRYSIEAFYLSVDAYCELIYTRRDGAEYYSKNIFINKPKEPVPRKILLYLLQVETQHSLFCSFEYGDAADTLVDVERLGIPKEFIKPQSKEDLLNKIRSRASESSSAQSTTNPIAGLITMDNASNLSKDRLYNQTQDTLSHQPTIVSIRSQHGTASDQVVTDANKLITVTYSKGGTSIKSIYKNDASNSDVSTMPPDKNSIDPPAGPSIYSQARHDRNTLNSSPSKEKVKLVGTRSLETANWFDKAGVVSSLTTLLEEFDANTDRFNLIRKKTALPREDVYLRGRSFGKEPIPNTKIVRVAGKSQDVSLNSRHTGRHFPMMPPSTITSNLSRLGGYKQERTHMPRDTYRGIDYKYSHGIGSHATGNSYRYMNFGENGYGAKKPSTNPDHYILN